MSGAYQEGVGGCLIFINRDRTYKHKYQHFYINHINPKNIFLQGTCQGEGMGNCFIFIMFRDRTFKHKYQYFHISQRYVFKKNIFEGRSAKYI